MKRKQGNDKQMSFNFEVSFSPTPVKAAEIETVEVAEVVKAAQVEETVAPVPVRPPKYLKNAVYLKDLNPDNTVLLDVGEKSLVVRPLGLKMVTRLLMYEKMNGEQMSWASDQFNFVSLMNTGMLAADHPVVKGLNGAGIHVALTPAAYGRLDAMRRGFKRTMTPFEFYVPEEFADMQSEDEYETPGPFVHEVYRSEYIRARKLLDEMGLTDPTRSVYLHEFQTHDVCQLACKYFAYMGHEQGLGKTLMAVALSRVLGYDNFLIVAPTATIGSWTSGWRHEIHRLGIPKSNIHVLERPEQLPHYKRFKYEDNGFPHYWLVDYGTLARERWEYSAFKCIHCYRPVKKADKGVCKNKAHKKKYCAKCAEKQRALNKANGLVPGLTSGQLSALREMWTGNYCDPYKGGCGWRHRKRVGTKTAEKKGFKETKPLYKCFERNWIDCVFLDESHMVKNIQSKRSRAVQALPMPKRLYIMTGTLITNYVEDTFWQLQRLCPAGLFPIGDKLEDYFAWQVGTGRGANKSKTGFNHFVERFQGSDEADRGKHGKVTKVKNPGEFWEMLARFMVRRKADDPAVESDIVLPETHFHTEMLEMDSLHKTIYDSKTGDFQKEMIAKISEANGGTLPENLNLDDVLPVKEAEVRGRLQTLRQYAVCPDREAIYGSKLTTKDKRILELVTEQMQKNHKTVVFTEFADHTNRLEDIFKEHDIPVLVVDSRLNKGQKWAAIDEWRTDGEKMVLLTTMSILGTGVNLTPLVGDFKCDMVVFASPNWVPATMYQAWRRVNRMGQTVPVHVYYLNQENTIEHDIDDLLNAKRKVISLAIDRRHYQGEGDVQQVSVHELMQRIVNKGIQNV